jgi:hypothetical protein
VIQSLVNLCMGIAKIYACCEFLSDCLSNLFSKMPICINCTCITVNNCHTVTVSSCLLSCYSYVITANNNNVLSLIIILRNI